MVEQVGSLKTGVKYKDTPIGKIPVDWEFASLGKIVYLQGGFAFKSKDYKEEGLPLVRISNVTSNEITLNDCVYLPSSSAEQHSSFLLESGDVLVAMSGATTGKIGLVSNKDLPALFNQRVGRFVIKDSNRITKSYLAQVVLTKKFKEELLTDAAGGAQPNVSGRNIERIMIPLPPLHEQKKIAEILTTVDEAIEKTTQTIAKTKELKKGLMQKVLTRGIGHKKFKKTAIGEIPVGWKVVKLGQVSDFKNGINFKKEQKGGRGILTIDVLNMYSTSIYIDPTSLYRIDLNLMNKEDYILKEGDILFVRSSVKREGVGWACLFKPFSEQATFCGFIIRARLIRRNIFPEFLIYFLRSDRVRERLISGSGYVAITNISQNTLQDLDIVIPSYSEQKEIAEILSSIDNEIEKESNHKEQLELLKKGLMQLLLTGKLRVAV